MPTATPSFEPNWGLLPPLHFSELTLLLGSAPYPQEHGQRPLPGYLRVDRSLLTRKLQTTSIGLALSRIGAGSYFSQKPQGPTTLLALCLEEALKLRLIARTPKGSTFVAAVGTMAHLTKSRGQPWPSYSCVVSLRASLAGWGLQGPLAEGAAHSCGLSVLGKQRG